MLCATMSSLMRAFRLGSSLQTRIELTSMIYMCMETSQAKRDCIELRSKSKAQRLLAWNN